MVDQTAVLNDFTLVVGVDAKTLPQLAVTLPTWYEHKRPLFQRPIIVFYDRTQLSLGQVENVRRYMPHAQLVGWPHVGVTYAETGGKWGNAQRAKMLAGFTYIPSEYVRTEYWLKLDTDVIATGQDYWIDSSWLASKAAIIAPPWSYTKPPTQMDELDAWVEKYPRSIFAGTKPLALHPQPGATKLFHRRICSWCAFFRTELTRQMAYTAQRSLGLGQCPVPSQDGFSYYVATRLGLPILRQPMKDRGWALVNHRTLGRMAGIANDKHGCPL